MSQGDWLEHARRHLDRAEWHRERGGDDLVYARNELAGAISDIWTAANEVIEDHASPRPIHLLDANTDTAACGDWIVRRGEWSRLTRFTTDPARATCDGCRGETGDGKSTHSDAGNGWCSCGRRAATCWSDQ